MNELAKISRAMNWRSTLAVFFICAAFTVTCVIEPVVPIVVVLVAYRYIEGRPVYVEYPEPEDQPGTYL